ncbi:MAG: hypothetical protein DME65_08105 [Verrucomicrobia bacterium]|nr:MAG: hypothetical protein DME65_08105 [Verrucomicrobiota bacterium]
MVDLASAAVQGFSRFINMVRLSVNVGPVYEIPLGADAPMGAIQHNEKFYTITFLDGSDALPVTPETSLTRRLIEIGLRDKLRAAGCSFKPGVDYVAYWAKKSDSPARLANIFQTFAGFEFRVVSYPSPEVPEEEDFYLTIDPHVILMMTASVENLVRMGIPTRDLLDLPGRIRPGLDVSETDEECSILDIKDDPSNIRCEVLKMENGTKETVPAAHVFIAPRPEVIQDKILNKINANFRLVEHIRQKSFLDSSQAPLERYESTRKVINFLGSHEVVPFSIGEIGVSVDQQFVPVTGTSFPREDRVAEPLLLFDKTDSSATHLQPYHGLRAFGAFTKDKPLIKLALLGSKAGLAEVEKMIGDLNKGTGVMPGGMARFFRTKLVIVDRETISSDSTDAYVNGAQCLATRDEKENQIGVVVTYLNDRTPPTSLDSPYFAVKPVLLERGLPSQMLTRFVFQKPEWKHVTIGSALFAKAGGIPWVLAEDIEEFDMIIGVSIGERISTTKRSGAKLRFVSYANIFDRLGRWMFFESMAAQYDYTNHEQQFAQLIDQSLDRYKEAQNSYPATIAIHYYKRFGKEERRLIIEKVTAKVPEARIAFVTIDTSHPMRLYDLRITDGSFPRCHFVHLSDWELLISATGYTELSQKRIGTPVFLKVSFNQYPEPFVEGASIAKQVLALTRLNYKAMTPLVGQPVTLEYAALAARFTAAFSENQWKGVLSPRIRRVPWFL